MVAARAARAADKRIVAASTQQTELATDTGYAHATAGSQPMPGPRSPLSHAIRRLDRTGAAEMAAVAGANSMETDDSHTGHTLAQTAIA